MDNLLDIQYIETIIFIFFIYSFAGWFMESIGGILFVKKFINRGFLIGPYCPVYGIGVVMITVFLDKYKSDYFVFFSLTILICGLLEYATSYYMEKWFNARWWDYSNKKFNINGRVCLSNLCLFGIGAGIIEYYLNPIIISSLDLMSVKTRYVLSISLVLIFIIDAIVSLKIIASLKGEIAKQKKDSTEEIVNRVKDKTEDLLMQAESSAIEFTRDVKYISLRVERKVKYTGKRFTAKGNQALSELTYRVKDKKHMIDNIITKQKNDLNTIIEEFKNKSIFNKRLIDAFPKIQIKSKMVKSRGEENKIKHG